MTAGSESSEQAATPTTGGAGATPAREVPFTMIRGFAMGAADIVPGVSGGTIALVFGIYQRLIESIRDGSSAMGSLLKGNVSGFRENLAKVDWWFLIPLLAGMGLAIVSLAGVIQHQLEENPEAMAGLFTGLVLGSVIIAWGLLNVRDGARIATLLAVAVAVFLALGLREGTTEEAVSQATNPALWAYFFAGALAVCAMILPGISGSFILVMIGMYGAVLSAVSDLDMAVLAVVAFGCVVGLGLFSQVLHWALNTHYDTVMAALIGLMLGSLRVLWPWPAGVDSTRLDAPGDPLAAPLALALLGLVLVLGIDWIGRRSEHRTEAEEAAEIQSI